MASYIANINTRHRLTQVIVFVVSILACMLFSELANAQRPNNRKFDRPKFRTIVHREAERAVMVLHKKRNSMPKHPTFFASNKRAKTKQLAETDEPSGAANSN